MSSFEYAYNVALLLREEVYKFVLQLILQSLGQK
jgi:hypothetical protein